MQSSVSYPDRPHRALARTVFILLAAVAGGCSGNGDGFLPAVFERPETAVSYKVVLEGSPSDEITALAEQSLASYRLRAKGAASLAFLQRRAESDVDILLKILRSRGYYSASAGVTIEETEPGTALVTITAEPGQAYTLTRHNLVIERAGTVAPPLLDAAALGSPVGDQALSAAIAAAEAAAVVELHRAGFPYAEFEGRSGLADPSAATLEVESTIAAGPAFTFGAVTFDGLETVDEAYLLSYLPWDAGQAFDASALREFQHRLIATDLFAAVAVRPPDEAPRGAEEPAPLPVTVALEEGPRRRITGSLRYDTDLGPTVRVAFEHRNLFGANERFLVEVDVGLDEQSLGFGVRKPQFLRPGQELLAGLTLQRTDKDAFDALTVNVFAGLERQVNDRWRGGLGALGEASVIDDNSKEATAYLLGAPLFATYEGSNDLFNPTDGERLRLEATPFFGVFDHSDTEFLVLNATGSIYRPLDDGNRLVIAARGRVASILAPDLESIPATRRLYSGGGGSVRGYALDFIGPLDNDNDPVGGRSALEAGVELRARLFGDIGGVVFAEAGAVSTEMFPDFAEGVQAAAGLGLRYYSAAGPIRIDVGFPVNGRSADDTFQIYFSIGQAF
ncbi:MAG: autotransporter assembly complex protein TamA [Thermohalobaculum sp.]